MEKFQHVNSSFYCFQLIFYQMRSQHKIVNKLSVCNNEPRSDHMKMLSLMLKFVVVLAFQCGRELSLNDLKMPQRMQVVLTCEQCFQIHVDASRHSTLQSGWSEPVWKCSNSAVACSIWTRFITNNNNNNDNKRFGEMCRDWSQISRQGQRERTTKQNRVRGKGKRRPRAGKKGRSRRIERAAGRRRQWGAEGGRGVFAGEREQNSFEAE